MALAAFLAAGCDRVEEAHYLGFVPRELNVTTVLYSKDESAGLGPGANESGVVAFDLPGTTADRMREQGLVYFRSLRCDEDASRGCYEDWRPTPPTDADLKGNSWPRTPGEDGAPALRLKDFLHRYGVGVAIDPSVESAIDGAIASPGNFYAFGSGGSLILVVPSARRVYLAYSG